MWRPYLDLLQLRSCVWQLEVASTPGGPSGRAKKRILSRAIRGRCVACAMIMKRARRSLRIGDNLTYFPSDWRYSPVLALHCHLLRPIFLPILLPFRLPFLLRVSLRKLATQRFPTEFRSSLEAALARQKLIRAANRCLVRVYIVAVNLVTYEILHVSFFKFLRFWLLVLSPTMKNEHNGRDNTSDSYCEACNGTCTKATAAAGSWWKYWDDIRRSWRRRVACLKKAKRVSFVVCR